MSTAADNKPSRYDELFDKYQGILKTKRGTKYEMLTALIFKLLDESRVVIHDIRLIGETETESQIDVCVDVKGVNRRILIECKDFDASKKKKNVGIGIIRGFWAVVDDTKPDESIVITCNGFSKEAMKYAKAKGIKLAILREFREEDKEGRLLSVEVRITEQLWNNPRPFLVFYRHEDLEKWQADLVNARIEPENVFGSDRIFINTPIGRCIFYEFLNDVLNGYSKKTPGHVKCEVPEGVRIEVEERGEISIALTIDFDIVHRDYFFESVSKKVAALILEPLEKEDDIVFFGEDMVRYEIDPDSGEVKPRK